MYPDFLIIGAQKAGTTWLHHNLQAHPGVWMPKEKELHYFDEKIKQGGGLLSRLRGDRSSDLRWRRQAGTQLRRLPNNPSPREIAWNLNYFLRKPNDEWYASLFEPGAGKVTGETTPDYSILDGDTIAHVHRLMPRARVILMMRSPLERPWSAMDMRLRVRGQSVEEVKDRKFYRRFDNRGSRSRTDYLRTLENWGAFYPEDQIFVGFLEDVHFFPEKLLESVYAFLGVDAAYRPPGIGRKIHSGLRDTMPTRFALHLARTYRGELEELHERFGGYASFWRYCAGRLTDDPPEGESVPYPFWEGPMWEDWVGGAGEGPKERPQPQSGPLASARAALG